MNEREACLMSATTRLLWLLVLVAPLTLFGGWVLSITWGWFFVPLGAPEIGLLHAAGIYLTLRLVMRTGVTTSTNHPLLDAAIVVGTGLIFLCACALLRLGV